MPQELVTIERELLEQKEKEFELQSKMKQDRDKVHSNLITVLCVRLYRIKNKLQFCNN